MVVELSLEEEREKAKQKFAIHQQIVKCWSNKHSSDKKIEVNDLILKWDKPNNSNGKHTKFQQL